MAPGCQYSLFVVILHIYLFIYVCSFFFFYSHLFVLLRFVRSLSLYCYNAKRLYLIFVVCWYFIYFVVVVGNFDWFGCHTRVTGTVAFHSFFFRFFAKFAFFSGKDRFYSRLRMAVSHKKLCCLFRMFAVDVPQEYKVWECFIYFSCVFLFFGFFLQKKKIKYFGFKKKIEMICFSFIPHFFGFFYLDMFSLLCFVCFVKSRCAEPSALV